MRKRPRKLLKIQPLEECCTPGSDEAGSTTTSFGGTGSSFVAVNESLFVSKRFTVSVLVHHRLAGDLVLLVSEAVGSVVLEVCFADKATGRECPHSIWHEAPVWVVNS